MRVRWAYQGKEDYEKDGPHRNLRIIAAIEHPSWLGVAVRAESGITDLFQIKERKLPVRVRGRGDSIGRLLLGHYGLSRELIESWGGRFPEQGGGPGLPTIPDHWEYTGDFDLVIGTLYTANTPEARHWIELSVRFNLRFLPVPTEVINLITKELGGRPCYVPHQLLRGVHHDLPSVARDPQVIYGRDDMPEDFAFLLAKALDENRHLFRETALPYSYDPMTVALEYGVPLHDGAKRYYSGVGYPTR